MTIPASPPRHDGVTMACALCGSPFPPIGRRRFCSGACRAIAWRRRRMAARPVLVVPAAVSRMSVTVYECDVCGSRAVGEQRCAECATFMRRVGAGGACPHCDEPVTVADLTGQEVGP